MHQTFSSPPIAMLVKAINNDQLEGIPFMKAYLIRKYLPSSPATLKGRIKCPKAGIHSTYKEEAGRNRHAQKVQDKPIIIPEDEPASETHKVNNIFCYAAVADKQNGTMYLDATCTLPAMSLDGHQCYFIAYDYDSNYIFEIPMKDVTEDSIIEDFDQVFT